MTAATITQADRDAAAKITSAAELRPLILSGRFDEHQYVQAFAKHREAETAAIVAWLRHGEVQNFGSGFRSADRLAKAIESGEHNLLPAK